MAVHKVILCYVGLYYKNPALHLKCYCVKLFYDTIFPLCLFLYKEINLGSILLQEINYFLE